MPWQEMAGHVFWLRQWWFMVQMCGPHSQTDSLESSVIATVTSTMTVLGKLKNSQATSHKLAEKNTVPAVGQLVIPIMPWSNRKLVIIYIVVDPKQNKSEKKQWLLVHLQNHMTKFGHDLPKKWSFLSPLLPLGEQDLTVYSCLTWILLCRAG